MCTFGGRARESKCFYCGTPIEYNEIWCSFDCALKYKDNGLLK